MTGNAPSAAAENTEGLAVELRALTVEVAGRKLLERTSVQFAPGRVTLIVGSSGAGKSILLRIIAGLLPGDRSPIQVEGQVLVGGKPLGRQTQRRVGVVFQHFALFDELSPLDNVRMAAAHAARSSEHGPSPEQLLGLLRVPHQVPTSSLSGGQRQRLAIARTLAADPDVVLYDEPTSGLDAATAKQVATLIQRTHSNFPKTSIIVTHDYHSLAPIADEIYVLDARTRTLRRLEPHEWQDWEQHLQPGVMAEESVARVGSQLAARIKQSGTEFFVTSTRVVEAILQVPLALVPRWASAAWGLRYAAHYLRLVAGPSAWLYIAVAGAILGFVATYFTFRFLPYPQYTKPLLVEDLLTSIGFALYRILVPVLATVLIAARCGAAVASDVGGKRYAQQIDALRTLGARPFHYLLTNILYSFLLGTPLLALVGFVVARFTSLAVFMAIEGERGPAFWQLHFHRQLVDPNAWWYVGTGWLLAKLLACALGIATIAYWLGMQPKESSREVSRGITRTILWSTLYVLLVHFVFALLEFEPGRGGF